MPLKSRQVLSWQPVLFQDDSPILFSSLSQPSCGKCSPCSLCNSRPDTVWNHSSVQPVTKFTRLLSLTQAAPHFQLPFVPLAVFTKAPGIPSASSSASPPDPLSSSLFPDVLQLLHPRGLLSPSKERNSPTFFLWFYKINNHLPVAVRCNVKSLRENHIQRGD